MALRLHSCGLLILPVALSTAVLARPDAAPAEQAPEKSIYVTVIDDASKPVAGLPPRISACVKTTSSAKSRA